MSHSVTLPCEPERFAEFISGLLGKPQTITRIIEGPFEIRREDISDLFHLIDQRISSQNDAKLVQFTVRIAYDDNSTVLLNSLPDLLAFNEVKPLVSIAVHLTWVYLVQFRTKRIPEKQQIELSFGTNLAIFDRDPFIIVTRYGPRPTTGNIFLRINHTDRTWGTDIDALLSGHIRHYTRETQPTRKFVQTNSGWFGLAAAILIALPLIGGFSSATAAFASRQLELVDAIKETTIEAIAKKVDFVNLFLISNSRFEGLKVLYVVLGFLAVLSTGIIVSALASQSRASFVLMTRRSEEVRSQELVKWDRGWRHFLVASPAALALGVAGNYAFYLIAKNIGLH